MKKIIVIITALTVTLAGCSSKKTPVIDTITRNASPSNNHQSQSQQESTAQPVKTINSNPDTSLLDNIDTTKSPFEKGYYDYKGTISNNLPVQMSIYPLEKDIVGAYFYESQKKEIKLKGKAGAKDIVLYEYDETGKNTGIFKGSMNTVDKIEGTWTSADNKISYPFILSLKSILPGVEYGKRYSVAVGTVSDQEVESFVSKIQGYIAKDNKIQLAKYVRYPINVKINDKVTRIQDEDGFIENYDRIFHLKYKEAICNASSRYLFSNWQGIMFEAGLYNIWINEITPAKDNSKLMITAINN
jgi:hypothetical protein